MGITSIEKSRQFTFTNAGGGTHRADERGFQGERARCACRADYCRDPRGGLTTRCDGHIIRDGSDEGPDASSLLEMGNASLREILYRFVTNLYLRRLSSIPMNFSWLVDGKVAGHAAPASDEDLDYLRRQGLGALVRMAEAHRSRITSAQVEQYRLTDCHVPVKDFTTPTQEQLRHMVGFISESVAQGKPVGVSCRAGLGRTGTVLACYLVSKCLSAGQAINEVRTKRPHSIETGDQEAAICEYAQSLGK